MIHRVLERGALGRRCLGRRSLRCRGLGRRRRLREPLGLGKRPCILRLLRRIGWRRRLRERGSAGSTETLTLTIRRTAFWTAGLSGIVRLRVLRRSGRSTLRRLLPCRRPSERYLLPRRRLLARSAIFLPRCKTSLLAKLRFSPAHQPSFLAKQCSCARLYAFLPPRPGAHKQYASPPLRWLQKCTATYAQHRRKPVVAAHTASRFTNHEWSTSCHLPWRPVQSPPRENASASRCLSFLDSRLAALSSSSSGSKATWHASSIFPLQPQVNSSVPFL